MEEMTTMMEVTTEETMEEMVPVVETNNEVYPEENNSGMNPLVGMGVALGALAIGGIVAGVKKHKARKAEPKVDVEKKPKKHIKFRTPWEVTEEEAEVTENEESNEVNSEEE